MWRLTNPNLPAKARAQPRSLASQFQSTALRPHSPVFRVRYNEDKGFNSIVTEIPSASTITPLWHLSLSIPTQIKVSLKDIIPYQVRPNSYWSTPDGEYYFCTGIKPTVFEVASPVSLPVLQPYSTEITVTVPPDFTVSDIQHRGTRLGFVQTETSLLVDVCNLCCSRAEILTATAVGELAVNPELVGQVYLFDLGTRLGSIQSVEWRSRVFTKAQGREFYPGEFHWDWRSLQLKICI